MTEAQMDQLEEFLVDAFTQVLTEMGPDKIKQISWFSAEARANECPPNA